jgi:Tfp pilus assembly protein PilW
MKSSEACTHRPLRKRFSSRSAFTYIELLVASSCGALVLASAMVFMNFARISVSGIAAQVMVSNTGAQALAIMQSRIRLATSVAVDSTGNTLTLGFDDDPTTDSSGDGVTYNDADHYETFQFVGTNGTGTTTAAGNKLIYTPKVGVATNMVLVRYGVRNLPSYNIFSIANGSTVLIRFGVIDTNVRDHFQSVDIQATGVPLNRPASTYTVPIIN